MTNRAWAVFVRDYVGKFARFAHKLEFTERSRIWSGDKDKLIRATKTHSSREKLNARFAFLSIVRAIPPIPFFDPCLLVGVSQRARFLLKSRDIQVDKPVETCVLVDWHTEAASYFQ